MKRQTYFINTSRGPVVDEKALVNALKEGVIAGAGLDVFDSEPPLKDNQLYSMKNVVLTPHMAAHSEDGLKRMALMVARGVLDALKGKKPEFIANKHLLK